MTESGPFEVIELLGEGSYGTVVAALRRENPEAGPVALKVLKKEFVQNKGILRSTRDEAKILEHLNHDNIVGVENLLDIGGAPVMVMEFVEGVCLEQILVEEGGGLPLTVALAILERLANALHCAHFQTVGADTREVQIIHRDIKSSNLLLSVDGKVKLIDFGIARCDLMGMSESLGSVTLGARPYMAPERLDGAFDTPSIDIYSMGVLFYELLTGEFLKLSINRARHDAMLQEQTHRLTLETEVVPLAKGICNLIGEMCAYDPLTRPSAMMVVDVIHRLEALLPTDEQESLMSYAERRVKPLYASREVSVPTDLVSGAITSGSTLFDVNKEGHSVSSPDKRWRKAVFFGGLLAVVLCLLALNKFFIQDLEVFSTVSVPVGARGWVDGTEVPEIGQMQIAPGDHIFQIQFGEGVLLTCPFTMVDVGFVQYVVDDGYAAIKVGDEKPVRCVSQ